LKSISNFSATGKIANDDDLELSTVETYVNGNKFTNFCRNCETDFSEMEPGDVNEHTEHTERAENTLMSLPTDALIYVCLFMEAADLCRLNLVSHEMYNISNCEIVWRALCLRYCEEVDEENVIKFYNEWLEVHFKISNLLNIFSDVNKRKMSSKE
jgi:hypothetical protein